jgi:hypothetical protein
VPDAASWLLADGRVHDDVFDHLVVAFVVNLMALCLFPFAAQPMLRVLFGSVAHQEFSRERKAALTRFVLDALCPPTAQER